jgi:hypothetical protein
MARTPIAALPNGTLQMLTTAPQAVLPLVAPQSQVSVTVVAHGKLTPLTVYSDESTSAVLTQPVLTDAYGNVPGFLDIAALSAYGADLLLALPGGSQTVPLVAPGLIGGTSSSSPSGVDGGTPASNASNSSGIIDGGTP